MRNRASRKTPDVSAFFHRPTAPHLAVFILRSVGRVASRPWPHDQTCENVRHSAKDDQTGNHGLRSDDLGTKRLSAGGLLVVGVALAVSGGRNSSAARFAVLHVRRCAVRHRWLCRKQRTRPAPRAVIGRYLGCGQSGMWAGVSNSDATSLGSKYASFGMSKFGALSFPTVVRTACANPASGRSHEPR